MLYDKKWNQTKARQLLDRAADYIEVYGWCQNRFGNKKEKSCLYGALTKALNESEDLGEQDYNDANYILMKVVYPVHPIHWNDKEGRTKDEVIDLLRSLANG